MGEAEVELRSSLNLINQSYLTYSVVSGATNMRVFNEETDRDIRLEDISIKETVPWEWFGNPAICPEPFFYDIGRNLAIFEENYLIRTIKGHSDTAVEIPHMALENILQAVTEFIKAGNTDLVMSIPAELSLSLYENPEALEFQDNMNILRVTPDVRVRLFLTSKYVELKDILLISRNFATWIYMQGNHNGLLIGAHRLNEQVSIVASIQASYKIERPDASRVIRLHVTAHTPG
jgi:hypothetical protein